MLVKITVVVGVILAAISVPLGLAIDSDGYWTNIVSNVTGASLGIPLAVLFLVRVYDSRNVATEKKKVRSLARRAAEDLREAIESCLPSGFEVDEFARLHIELTNRIQTELAVWLVRAEYDEVELKDWAEIRSMLAGLLYSLEEIDSAPFPEWREGWWDEVETAWDYLDQVVRPKVFELEEPWLPVKLRSLLRRGISFGDPLYFQRDVETGLANTLLTIRKLESLSNPGNVESYKNIIRRAGRVLYRDDKPWGERNYFVFQLYLLRACRIASLQLQALTDGPEAMDRMIEETLPEFANIP